MALVSVVLFGVTEMASGKDPSDSFEIRSGQGEINPAPPMIVMVEEGKIVFYARGRSMSALPETAYVGIGKYVLDVDEHTGQQIDSVKEALSSRTFAPEHGLGHGPVLDFSFEKNGRHYQGEYNYQLGEAFNNKLYPLYQIADKVLKNGHSEINLHPVFTAHSDAGGFVLELTFGNDGEKDIRIAGPDTWSPDLARPDQRNVQISAINDVGTSFCVRLVSRYLSEASRRYAKEITVKPGEPVTLAFSVPYSAVTFSDASSSRRITSGSYRFIGEMTVDVLAPAVVSGKIYTPMKAVPAIYLQAQISHFGPYRRSDFEA
ncbi:hypothetical protein BCY88_28680 [Paraburkholderia fungorum]|uniref:Uncharacterized protein n=2 Tax=Paraburkholderia fungorum TaxID=134537 RepID=A0A3R7ILN6_9BURK|nr:hypothetical protein BCY88_28680 [Paraburkholderia fungorum]